MKKIDLLSKKILVFLLMETLLVVAIGIPLLILKPADTDVLVMACSIIFMWFPVIATFLTKKITHDDSKVCCKLHFRVNWKAYLLSAYLPSVLVLVGAAFYFIIFPDYFDLGMSNIKTLVAQVGQDVVIPELSIGMIIAISIGMVLLAPFVFVNHILAFGEEYGWRGYLLPLLCEKIGSRKGILLNGALWGFAHAPLVCVGVNYTGSYWGRPFTGIIMMVLFAMVVGIFLSYLTLKTKSIIPACIAHGVINAVREAPLFVCCSVYNALLGPKISGIIGMAGFIILAAFLFCSKFIFQDLQKDT